jgi:hypothetical protein
MINFNIYNTLILSIIVQITTGVFDIYSLFVKIPSQFYIIRQLLILELLVQVIESLFYIYWLFDFNNITNVTPKRYFDWVITTPTMLITLIFYLIFLDYKQKNANTNENLEFFDIFNKNFNTIISVILLNWLMLLFGYLGEVKILPVFLGVFLGFIPFLIYYYIIYKNYAILTNDGMNIFLYFFIVWSLYGIVAVLPYKIKNMFYNILDLFSKNFFGLFLAYIIITNKY